MSEIHFLDDGEMVDVHEMARRLQQRGMSVTADDILVAVGAPKEIVAIEQITLPSFKPEREYEGHPIWTGRKR